jgi:hypothetical protein
MRPGTNAGHRMRCGITKDEEAGSALGKLRATLAEHVTDAEERSWVEPRLAHLLGLEEGVSGDQENLFSAWGVLFERLAEIDPVVLVFEDMQWADAGLLDFLDYLLDWSRNHPIFVLSLARPELAEKHPTWGAGKRAVTSLYLEPLPRLAMEDLIHGLVPGLPEELRSQILDRAEGIPLYAVETVRMLLDRGLLAHDGTAFRPTGPIETLEVPETLHALVAARLDGLFAEERASSRERPCSGRPSRSRASVQSADSPRRRSTRCSRRCCARRSSRSRPIRAHRSAASTRFSRTSSSTSPTRRSRSASGRRSTSPRRGTWRPSGAGRRRTRSSRSSPRITSTPGGRRPTPTTRKRSRGRPATC